jgi:predicted lipoprotein with Yx(FWY)xxD motif
MSKKVTLQVKVDKDLNNDFNDAIRKKGVKKWVAVERGMQLYIEECEKEQGDGKG